MPTYLTTIGLEIHLKLKTACKIFCRCQNEQNFDSPPNQHICPVCTGQPGALPLLNQECVDKAVLFGRLINADIQPFSSFDRKNYFYPDLPMGFQITQFYQPIIQGGTVNYRIKGFEEEKKAEIHEAHLENDTAKMIHENGQTLLDFDRAGTPLIEIVSEPTFSSAQEAVEYAKEIQRLVRRNDISDADMEKGQMRIDVNLSIRKNESDPLGIRTEMKNINTFNAMKRAIETEYLRQKEIIESGGEVQQETRRRDDMKGESFMMRSKADAVDYRYFPEPDMPILQLHLDEDQSDLFIPSSYIQKCKQEFGFSKEYINTLLNDKQLFDFFFEMVKKGFEPKNVAKWIAGPLMKSGISSEEFLREYSQLFISFLEEEKKGNLMDNQLKIVFDETLETKLSPAEIIKIKGFDVLAMDEDALKAIIQEVISDNPVQVEQYRTGKETLLAFFLGQVMRKSGGKVSPQVAQGLIKSTLVQNQ
ncbi:aspartyl/glutamyl-tRNA(Asn/Gln) amidotransferase subunit B [candidate division SR1 bacterium]|nr:aspartyl/glutamyl-tRNA(Asn/Gln) amidotransferase subunit B [candidate division SR1 bacterium]